MPTTWRPDLQGWLTDNEATSLRELAAGRHVLEIGVWKARATIAMAEAAWSVLSVDWFRGDAYTGPANTLPEAWANICRDQLQDTVTLIVGDFREILPRLDLADIMLAVYDADHSGEATSEALRLLLRQLNPEAVIAVHDYEPGKPDYAAAVAAIDQAARESGRRLAVVDRLAILFPEPETPLQGVDNDADTVPVPDVQPRPAAA